MWIYRDIQRVWDELEREYSVIVITGSRQVGKTSLLEEIYGSDSLVSLDLPRIAEAAETTPEEFLGRLQFPAIIDEVQYAPSLFRPIKSLVDRVLKKSGEKLLLTGSERFHLMEGVTESLAGRAAIIDLSTLSLNELENHFKKKAEKSQLLQWLLDGGYPALHAQVSHRQRFYSNLVATYIERDVKRQGQVQSSRDFDRFLRLCAARTGQILSMNSIASDLQVSQTTVKKWLGILVASGIVELVEPWFSNVTKRLVKRPKLYFRDTGLCSFLLGLDSVAELQRSVHLGALFENLCFNQLSAFYQNQGLLKKIFYFRTKDGAEVDFVVSKGSEVVCYECKYSENPKHNEKCLAEVERLTGLKVLSLGLLNSGREPFWVNKDKGIYAQSVVDAGRPLQKGSL